MKNLLKLKNSPLRNLSTVIRYSGFKLIQPESVDTHTMDMNVLALIVLDHFESEFPKSNYLDRKDLIYRIVIHDLEESCSCDVPRSLKYYNDEVHKAIDEATKGIVKPHVSDRLYNDMYNSKNLSTLEGRVVKFLDIFQCNLILNREVNGYGNARLDNLLDSAKEFLNKAIIEDDLFINDVPDVRNYFRNLVIDWNRSFEVETDYIYNNNKVDKSTSSFSNLMSSVSNLFKVD